MFGFILFIVVLSFIGSLFSRPFYGYYRRPRIYRPFGGFGSWGWGMGPHYGPMCRGPHHHHHHHHHMGHGRMW